MVSPIEKKRGGINRAIRYSNLFSGSRARRGIAGSKRTLDTSVSSEIEFCGIAPRLPRKISIKFHQIRRSSAGDSMATFIPPKTRARSLAQSICHRLI